MIKSKRSDLPARPRSFGLGCFLAIVVLIACVTAQAQTEDAYGPDPKKRKPVAENPGAAVPPPSSLRLVEIFSVEQNPGAGFLEYQSGKDPAQKIPFGAESGIYGLAMAFNGKNLPDQYGKNFQKDIIVQVALGTLKSKLEQQVPQFAAATLIGGKIPNYRTRYPIVVPQANKVNTMKSMSLILFTLPNTPNELSDEQKLRSTFFAQSGFFELQVKGKPKIVDVQAQGKPLRFKMLPLEMNVNLALGTPFSAQQATLKGTIQIPLYTPHGQPAIEFTQRIAGESLEGTIKGKEAPREVASPKK